MRVPSTQHLISITTTTNVSPELLFSSVNVVRYVPLRPETLDADGRISSHQDHIFPLDFHSTLLYPKHRRAYCGLSHFIGSQGFTHPSHVYPWDTPR